MHVCMHICMHVCMRRCDDEQRCVRLTREAREEGCTYRWRANAMGASTDGGRMRWSQHVCRPSNTAWIVRTRHQRCGKARESTEHGEKRDGAKVEVRYLGSFRWWVVPAGHTQYLYFPSSSIVISAARTRPLVHSLSVRSIVSPCHGYG